MADTSASPDAAGCSVCGGRTRVLDDRHPGFQAMTSFAIHNCANCDLSYAVPTAASEAIYDAIYANSWRIPGYSDYHTFAEEIHRASEPLTYLANASPVYWAIREAIDQLRVRPDQRILDFGCGLGYLTYAVAALGLNVRGIDISEEAVKNATRRFGPLYEVCDLRDGDSMRRIGTFDVILCPEVIEHVEEPVKLLSRMREVLREEGSVILTTPNKSAYPANALWGTDWPPVHLWWLSYRAVERMAEAAGFKSCLFIDVPESQFTGVAYPENKDWTRPNGESFLDKHGNVRFGGRRRFAARVLARRLLGRMGLLNTAQRIRRMYRRHPSAPLSWVSGGPSNICAILKR